ncbi:hypothetical protein ACFRFL_42860 [Streptomyces sp. NPDC056708]
MSDAVKEAIGASSQGRNEWHAYDVERVKDRISQLRDAYGTCLAGPTS